MTRVRATVVSMNYSACGLEIGDWFETLAKAERSHANRFQKALDALVD